VARVCISGRAGGIMLGRGRWLTCAVALVATLAGGRGSLAQDAARYSLQGTGGWAYGETNNDNFFGYSASPEGVWDNYYFALNVGAHPMEKLSIRAQAFWGDDLRGERVKLDYVFAEWAHSSNLKLRVGKVLVPFGLYSETYDVGTLRPFYLLPQFYAGTLGLVPKAYLGGGLTGAPRLGEKWELQYDAFGGQIEFEPFFLDRITGFDPGSGLPSFTRTTEQMVGEHMVGGRLLLVSSEHGVDVGGSAIHMGHVKVPEGSPLQLGSANLYNLRAQYQKGPLAARAEYFRGDSESDEGVASWYVEASFRFLKKLQLAAQYEHSRILLSAGDESIPETLRRHESLGLALNLWVSPEFVLKLNGYTVDGNMVARPDNPGLAAVLGTIGEKTGVLLIGAQFSF
jgi:hypothetical protein